MCVVDVVLVDGHFSEKTEPHDSEEWLQVINRGGLISIDDCMFQLLVAIEIELRNHLTASNAAENIKERAIQGIIGCSLLLGCYFHQLGHYLSQRATEYDHRTLHQIFICKSFHGEVQTIKKENDKGIKKNIG